MSEARLDDAHQDSHQGRHQGGGYRRIELITGEARRRPWTAEEKARILAESFQPGAKVADVARRHGMNRSLLVELASRGAQARCRWCAGIRADPGGGRDDCGTAMRGGGAAPRRWLDAGAGDGRWQSGSGHRHDRD